MASAGKPKVKSATKNGPKTRRDFATEADYLRHHRRCFTFAVERGITPKQAEAELAKIDHLEAMRNAQGQLELERPPATPRAARTPITPQQSYANTARLLGERPD